MQFLREGWRAYLGNFWNAADVTAYSLVNVSSMCYAIRAVCVLYFIFVCFVFFWCSNDFLDLFPPC